MPVGFLTSGDGGEWVPNMEYIGPGDWRQLADVPATLQAYKQECAAFSVARCAVARNCIE